MKFTHVLVALVDTVAQAKPLEKATQYEETAQLAKRANASFTVWTNDGKEKRPPPLPLLHQKTPLSGFRRLPWHTQ